MTIGIITALIAFGGLYFAVRHNKQKARLEAYPKRIAVFRCTEEFLARAWTHNYDYQPALLATFYHCKREAEFLFDKRLANYLDSLYEGVEEYFRLANRLEIEGDDLEFEEKSGLQHRVWASQHWLGQENQNFRKQFKKYLDLSAVK
jgi:hypothetical protein